MRLLEFLNKTGDASLPNGSAEIVLGTLRTTVPSDSLPIDADPSDWLTVTSPERIVKIFKFDNPSHVAYFVSELMGYQEEANHHAKITIDYRDVTVESYTHDIESVTRQDLILAEFCDEIYSDIMFLDYSRRDNV